MFKLKHLFLAVTENFAVMAAGQRALNYKFANITYILNTYTYTPHNGASDK